MIHQQRMVSVLVAAIIALSSLVLTTSSYSASSDVVSKQDMETYVQAFLDSYNTELEANFRPQFRDLFPFSSDFTYRKNATISSNRGAALEFSPWNQDILYYKTISTRLESAIFKYIDLNTTTVVNSTGYKVVIYTGDAPRGAPFITVLSGSHVSWANTIFVTNRASFAAVAKGGELFLSNAIVDERHFHMLIMRGNNESSAWTSEQAEIDARIFFEMHLYRAFDQSEEFREFLAIPELSQLLEEIIQKHLHDEQYDLSAFQEDLEEVRELAREKYHVSTEFVDELLDYLEKIALAPSPLPWWEVAPWSWILGALVSIAVTAIVMYAYRRMRKKSKKKKRSRTARGRRKRK